MNKSTFYGKHAYYFRDLTVKLYRINLSKDPWHTNQVFTAPVSPGITNPIWAICLCTVLVISDLKRGWTCLCLKTFSLSTFHKELTCLLSTLHPFIDYILLENKFLLNLIRPETGLKLSLYNFTFTFLKPQNFSGT